MRCLNPRRVSFEADGKTIAWTPKKWHPEFASFKLPCSKCLECRLNYARENAIRCVHEAKMHLDNSFITLTYSDKHLKSPRLQYRDFQLFLKRLREKYVHTDFDRIGYFVTGEYGDRTKRPHWHAIIFNWAPSDQRYLRQNERGDQIFTSSELDSLWGHNDATQKPNEIGTVTMESAGYVARYAAKKLTHGKDQDHDFHPIHKRSTRPGIGRSFFLKYHSDMFNNGYVVLPDGSQAPIPRYYERLYKTLNPSGWYKYMVDIKLPQAAKAESDFELETHKEAVLNERREAQGKFIHMSQTKARKKILESNFKRLQECRQGE